MIRIYIRTATEKVEQIPMLKYQRNFLCLLNHPKLFTTPIQFLSCAIDSVREYHSNQNTQSYSPPNGNPRQKNFKLPLQDSSRIQPLHTAEPSSGLFPTRGIGQARIRNTTQPRCTHKLPMIIVRCIIDAKI